MLSQDLIEFNTSRGKPSPGSRLDTHHRVHNAVNEIALPLHLPPTGFRFAVSGLVLEIDSLEDLPNCRDREVHTQVMAESVAEYDATV